MAALDEVLAALSDPTRRRIYQLLGDEPGLTTAQLTGRFRDMSRWGVMKHLDVLRSASLVQTLPEGHRRRHYRELGPLAAVEAWLAEQSQ